jgi:hypothetical protein
MLHGEKDADCQRICGSNGRDLHDRDSLAEFEIGSGRRDRRSVSGNDGLEDPTGSYKYAETARRGAETEGEEGNQEMTDFLSLPFVRLSELSFLPETAGLYFLIDDTESIAYIGESQNIKTRWRSHHLRHDLPRELDVARRWRVSWLECEGAEERLTREHRLIACLRPRLNAIEIERKARSQSRIRNLSTPILNAGDFAICMDVDYSTVMRWLKRGLVPNAALMRDHRGKWWEIPQSALQMERPQPGGRGKKRTPKGGTKKASKKTV